MPGQLPDAVCVDARHRAAARIVLAAIGEVRGKPTAGAPWGLSGGNALIAHRLTVRPTRDVDIAVGRMLGDWHAIENAVEEALADNGYSAQFIDKLNWGADGWGDNEKIGLSEWAVRAPGDDQDLLVKVSNFSLSGAPVDVPGIGPVIALRDVAGWKAAAFAHRRFPLDAFDTAELRTRFSVGELLKLARERHHGLSPAGIARAGRALDRTDDAVLGETLSGTGRTPGWMRAQLADWPRH